MCRIEVDQKLNPYFVLYNLVFGKKKSECVDTDELLENLDNLNTPMNREAVQEQIAQWYEIGLLQSREQRYFVA